MKKVIISGGGTGGHIYPAIAIADELKRRFPKIQILFVGAQKRMEMQKIPEAGYPIKGLWISGIQRKLTWDNLLFPFKLISSLWSAYRIVRGFRPDVVIGTGGYASAPTLKVAQWLKIPYVIQEQNSLAGVTNRWVAQGASKICVAYDGMERFFPKKNIIKTGNPVREDLLNVHHKRQEAYQRFDLQENVPVLLVLGGSLGAKAINQLVESQLDFFRKMGVQLLWQCGKTYYPTYEKYQNDWVKIFPFVKEMDYAYACADVIISRAGASSVSELCIVGKPVIFVPSPNVSEDHQTKNAQAIVRKNAGILIKEQDLQANFGSVFSELISSKDKQKELSQQISKLALANATKHIVDEIQKLIISK